MYELLRFLVKRPSEYHAFVEKLTAYLTDFPPTNYMKTKCSLIVLHRIISIFPAEDPTIIENSVISLKNPEKDIQTMASMYLK